MSEKEKIEMIDDDASVEIEVVEIGRVIKAHVVKIILFALLGAAVCLAIAYFLIKPTYESTAKLYIVSTAKDSVVDLSDLNVGTSLTKDYEELVLSYPVLDEVIENLKLDTTSKELASMITLTNPADTRVLCITVTTNDPKLSRDIANEVTNVTIRYLPETMSSNPPNIAQKPKVPNTKVAPSFTKYTVIGFLAGLLLSMIYFIMAFVMDDTIKSGEEMEKIFGTAPLATIPRSDKLSSKNNQKKNNSSKNNRNNSLSKGNNQNNSISNKPDNNQSNIRINQNMARKGDA